jgi:hypothetical protein
MGPLFVIVYESQPHKEIQTVQKQWHQVLCAHFHGIAVLYGTSKCIVVKSEGSRKQEISFERHGIERDLVALLKFFQVEFKYGQPIMIFSGHAWMFYVTIPPNLSYCGKPHCSSGETTNVLPISVVRDAIVKSGIKFFALVFDSCNMASLEACYELRNVTTYVVAHESYSYDKGLATAASISFLGTTEHKTKRLPWYNDLRILQKFTQYFVQNNLNTTMDVSIVKVNHVVPLVRLLLHAGFTRYTAKTNKRSAISLYWHTHDLYVSFMNDPRFSALSKYKFNKIFKHLVPHYRQTRKLRQLQRRLPIKSRHHGIAFSKKPAKDVGHIEKLLEIPV